jgi:hypothetical protein
MYYLGDTITRDFTTHDPSTGEVSDADVIPTCEVFEGDNDMAILTPTVVKRTNKTGNYRVSFSATTANGFEEGKYYNVIVQAIVSGITAKTRLVSFRLEPIAKEVIEKVFIPIKR